jgi:F-type H+-transporting ATPase subunit delta
MAHLDDSSGVAARYSAAVFALAAEQKKEAAVVQAFSALAEAIRSDVRAFEMLLSPVLTRNEKADALAASMKGADSIAVASVRMIALKGRAAYLPVIADALVAKLAEARRELQAQVITAHELSSAQQAALTEALRKATGKEIALHITIDKSVIGGMSIKVGSQFIDGTLAGSLQRLSQHLKQAA